MPPLFKGTVRPILEWPKSVRYGYDALYVYFFYSLSEIFKILLGKRAGFMLAFLQRSILSEFFLTIILASQQGKREL